MTRLIDETPAKELARFAVRMREAVSASASDPDTPIGALLKQVVSLPIPDPVLRTDILLGFLECCFFSIRCVTSMEDLDADERNEALAGLNQMAKVLDPMNFGIVCQRDLAVIFSEGSLVPRLQLAAQICREIGPEGPVLGADSVSRAERIIEGCTSIYGTEPNDGMLKQIVFEFHMNCRHVLRQSELFGRVGTNKTIERAVNRLVGWRYVRETVPTTDRDALLAFVQILGQLCQSLELRGQRGMSLATSLLINAVTPSDGGETVSLRRAHINLMILELMKDLGKGAIQAR